MPLLSMPLFVSIPDVMTRMQLSSELAGIDDVVTSGIIGSQLHVQRILGYKLQRQSHECMYHLDSDAFSGIQPGGMFRLEVPSGFIRQDIPVLLTASADIPTGATSFDSFDDIDPTVSKIEYERGYILIDAGQNTNCYVRVLCDTGFEDGTKPWPIAGLPVFTPGTLYTVGQRVLYNGVAYENVIPTTIVILSPPETPATNNGKWKLAYVPMEQIPTDVYEAIMSMVPVIFDNSQVTNRNKEAVDQYKKAADHSAMLLQPYTRTKGFTFRPVWTT